MINKDDLKRVKQIRKRMQNGEEDDPYDDLDFCLTLLEEIKDVKPKPDLNG